MQLESTMFAVCVIEVAPQLETLLRVPVDFLTKEVELTQDLLRLFIEYQIPSDLLACDKEDIGKQTIHSYTHSQLPIFIHQNLLTLLALLYSLSFIVLFI